ncbi:hypothetical protein FOTG_05266 [Fusarium oxysporum f. sp. vasinfectum 25433]|uniref:Uncharacterized protein n=1 Tax=Fusarium oxysporum f. sp. vasinfectum 25433 TaxID=1089449 RepID=X0LT00_FUSOX|nr:hypothetical protein FOTG_05266 [Fusarium oxysporum f. sp. vasinfectum 25433]
MKRKERKTEKKEERRRTKRQANLLLFCQEYCSWHKQKSRSSNQHRDDLVSLPSYMLGACIACRGRFRRSSRRGHFGTVARTHEWQVGTRQGRTRRRFSISP